ncbi:transposase [Streptomyces glaucus]
MRGVGVAGLGRSRGGFTSKPHLSADGHCRPLSLIVTPGQRADCTRFMPVLEKIRVPGPGPGRPRKKPDSLAADKAYGNGPLREYLRRRGIRRTLPEKTASQAARLRTGSRGRAGCLVRGKRSAVARPVVSGSRLMRVREWRKAVPSLVFGCGKRSASRPSKGATACGPRSRTVRWNTRREPREGVGQVAAEGDGTVPAHPLQPAAGGVPARPGRRPAAEGAGGPSGRG